MTLGKSSGRLFVWGGLALCLGLAALVARWFGDGSSRGWWFLGTMLVLYLLLHLVERHHMRQLAREMAALPAGDRESVLSHDPGLAPEVRREMGKLTGKEMRDGGDAV